LPRAEPILDRGCVVIQRPFTLREARSRGLERWHLRSRKWQRVGPAIYAAASRGDNTMLRLEAAACRLPAVSAFGGLSAAWLHGIHVAGCKPQQRHARFEQQVLAAVVLGEAFAMDRAVVLQSQSAVGVIQIGPTDESPL